MKWLTVCALALVLAGPAICGAQTQDLEQRNTDEYRDVEDGQPLKGVAYLLTPVGMLVEWGVARPLHYLATKTFMGPVLSGDKRSVFFTENNNAGQLPPETFAPVKINPTNNLQASNEVPVVVPPTGKKTAAQSILPSKPLLSGSQPALR